jgi:Protein of unknown function (DUF2934)
MKKTAGLNASTPSQEEIAERARTLWAGYGRPAGRDKEIWLEAERQLLGVDPVVEGSGGFAVSAGNFDEATHQKKPATRLGKPKVKTEPKAAPPLAGKPVAPAAKKPAEKPGEKPGDKKPLAKKPSVKKR